MHGPGEMMSKYKVISGAHNDVFAQVKMPGAPEIDYVQQTSELNTFENNTKLINKDLERQFFVDFNGKTREYFRETWRSPDVSLDYCQGKMTGAVLSKALLDTYTIPLNNADPRQNLQSEELGFGYYEEHEPEKYVPCGFSINYVKSDPSIWSACVIKNSTASDGKKEYMSVSSADIFPPSEGVENPDDLGGVFYEASDSRQFMKSMLLDNIKDAGIQALLSDIIGVDGKVNVEKIGQLRSRIVYRENIDDRDTNNPKLMEKIFDFKRDFPNCPAMNEYFNDMLERTKKDVNFFEDIQYEKLMSEMDTLVYPNVLRDFQTKLEKFNDPSSDKNHKLYQEGSKLIKCLNEINPAEPGNVAMLLKIVKHASLAVDNPSNMQNIRDMGALSQNLSGKSSHFWKALGAALLMFAGSVLFAFGVLAAIPSGGTSLLLSVLGASAIGASVGGAVAVAGAGAVMHAHGQEKGLAKSVTHFKTAVEKLKGANDSPSNATEDEIKSVSPNKPQTR